MGSVMDQERPWEKEEPILSTIHDRVRHALEFGHGSAIAQIVKELSRIEALITSASSHPDDLAVDRFATAMKAKLAKKRADGRGGWEDKTQCSREFLSQLMREHVEKGDPVDVANLAMMLHQRGEKIVTIDT